MGTSLKRAISSVASVPAPDITLDVSMRDPHADAGGSFLFPR
jgi:hypothetical protein